MMMKNDESIFLRHFTKELEQVAGDRVPNVRISVASAISEVFTPFTESLERNRSSLSSQSTEDN